MLRFRTSADSHIGHVRGNNEDSAFAGPYLLLVADGVGGNAAGEIASASTAYMASAISIMTHQSDPLQVLTDIIDRTHHHLQDGVASDPTRAGMSTTFTALYGNGEHFALAHIGDSRGYLIRDGELLRITRDHTLVQQLVDDGELTEEQAVHYPYRSVVLQALNADQYPDADLTRMELRPGDRLLLCSDGLTDLVPDSVIAELAVEPDLDAANQTLIDEALTAGGRDNVTCVLAEVETGARIRPFGTLTGAAWSPSNLIDGAAVRLPQPA